MNLNAIYPGTVVHTRLRPVNHRLKYRVFALLLDCDTLDALDKRSRLFSYNRFNLLSLSDRDHGDGSPVASYLRSLADASPMRGEVHRFLMLCYPRILGYVFNPLTVYYGLDEAGTVRLLIYEVNNTFGQRKTYVLPVVAQEQGQAISQSCAKELYVSPFNDVSGTYSFHVTPPGESLTVGVALRNADGPLLKAYFRGQRRPFTDAALLSALARTGWLTLKVTMAIHFEAARLWLKGLRLVKRPSAPTNSVTYVDPTGD